MTIPEKVAYLKGLAEGLELDATQSKEARLISVMIGILEEIGVELNHVGETVDELGEELDAVSDDLNEVERLVYHERPKDGAPAEESFYAVECPNCGEDLAIDESVLDAGTVECPACHEKFAIDLSDEEAEEIALADEEPFDEGT